ncbi:hypothetical protein [Limobrevibacterium gyesilva]|uniref:N-terminal of MaoC-like dehydratase domain-containing protein n=1 Tax=Limobrevibacterium gyesilva TaxID=2991712 RepID=A0AA42CJU8_9PROT|nr:hypothetical protein [Limobrevibacterium gyesilva]MCW3477215.1 hypothetical protein [Limobrevibacterium gyesilva]
MALGRYASDLEAGDDLGSFEYVVTPFVVREYTHSVELHQAAFQEEGAWPAPLVHIDKLRFFKRACPGGAGPTARIHYEFRSVWCGAIRTGDRITASAKVVERATRKGRDHIVIEIELRSSEDGRLFVRYRDTAILSYRQAEQAA